MAFDTLALLAIVVLTSLCIGMVCGYRYSKSSNGIRETPNRSEAANQLRFLFEKGQLTQADPAGLKLLHLTDAPNITWQDVSEGLSARIEGLPKVLMDGHGKMTTYPEDPRPDEPQAVLEESGAFTRLSLINMFEGTNDIQITPKASLGLAALTAPFPIWQTDEKGIITWKNRKFEEFGFPKVPIAAKKLNTNPAQNRISVTDPKSHELRYFDVLTQNLFRGQIYYGLNADCAVKAESIRRDFVQTLGKTFAQLSTGIAVFDNGPRLVMFNPALTDIFGLSAEFLSSRPTLQSLFDHMREYRMIPEPRNYVSWREQLTNLILGASEGKYRENWQLPTGETIRVTGQSHPEGALGFLFEDITAEISLSRRFKEDVSRAYGLMDAQPDPMAAINQHGVVFFTNKAFKDRWKTDPESSFADFTIDDLLNLIEPEMSAAELVRLRKSLKTQKPDRNQITSCQNAEFHLTSAEGKIQVLTQKPLHALPHLEALKNPAE
ncbi:MAG: PAS-domain containing protein [Cognatishimia sp.]|uniref:PAS-domain containing protein n=1 Tax=Cognatishimia sp. TaxID=2211648 RepID=UPI003B8AE9E8